MSTSPSPISVLSQALPEWAWTADTSGILGVSRLGRPSQGKIRLSRENDLQWAARTGRYVCRGGTPVEAAQRAQAILQDPPATPDPVPALSR